MALADDVKKILKNQVALKKDINKLALRVEALEDGVSVDEVTPVEESDDEPEREETPEPRRPRKESPPIENLGFKMFGGIAFLLLLIGFFSLYRYAVAQQWIGILGRVALGVLISVGIIVAGEFLRKKYAKYSQLLTGGGLALLYFTIYATYAFPDYRAELGMTLVLNAALLFAIVIAAVILALRYDSKLLACYAFIMGFLSSLLANISGNSHLSIISAILLSCGMIAIMRQKQWSIAYFPFIGSWLIYLIAYGRADIDAWGPMVTPLIIYGTALFLLFTYMVFLLQDGKDNTLNVILTVANAALFFFSIHTIIQEHMNELRGLFPVILAIFYLLCTKQAKVRSLENLYQSFFVLCITFLTVAIPLQFEGFIVTMMWAVEGYLLIEAGIRSKHAGIRGLGYIVLSIAGLQALFVDMFNSIMWKRLLNSMVTMGALFLSAYRLVSIEEKTTDNDKALRHVFFIGGVAMLTMLLAVEAMSDTGLFGSRMTEEASALLLTLLWAAEAYILYRFGEESDRPLMRTAGVVIAGVLLAKLFFLDMSADLWVLRLPGLIIGMILLTVFCLKEQKQKAGFSVILGLAAVLLLTITLAVEILDPNGLISFWSDSGRQVLLSVVWAAEAVTIIWYGLKNKSEIIGKVGVALFVLTIGKLLLKDLSVLEPLYRSIVSILVGFITLGGAFFYVKHKDQEKK